MALIGRALRAGYGSHAVLGGIDLTLDPGRFLCLLGPNGAGKSTLAHALCGLLSPGNGATVLLDEANLTHLSPRARAQHIGFLPQEIEPGFSFRVDETVELGARVAHPQPSREDIYAALAAVDAEHLAERKLDALSGGERRRVLLASVLAQKPRYLVLDEPTAMLDFEHQVGLFEVLRTRCEAGLGVLVVTHDLNLAAQWADSLVLLDRGRIAAQGRPHEVLTTEILTPVFGPHFQLLSSGGRPVVVPR
ncbi:MAG: ABC transporter ATP-binding protein [Planctomycetes bacterium]|nr:ABC transporter ATP-binding protein [Planctomycetota bacterium]